MKDIRRQVRRIGPVEEVEAIEEAIASLVVLNERVRDGRSCRAFCELWIDGNSTRFRICPTLIPLFDERSVGRVDY